jgi:hypothetical protein
MPSDFKSTIADLAQQFANQVLAAVKTASLSEILGTSGAAAGGRGRGRAAVVAAGAEGGRVGRAGPRRGRGGRMARRSPDDIAKVADQIVAILKKNSKGLRSEQIQSELGLAKNEIPRPLAKALQEKRISKKGEKRATTYFSSKRGK